MPRPLLLTHRWPFVLLCLLIGGVPSASAKILFLGRGEVVDGVVAAFRVQAPTEEIASDSLPRDAKTMSLEAQRRLLGGEVDSVVTLAEEDEPGSPDAPVDLVLFRRLEVGEGVESRGLTADQNDSGYRLAALSILEFHRTASRAVSPVSPPELPPSKAAPTSPHPQLLVGPGAFAVWGGDNLGGGPSLSALLSPFEAGELRLLARVGWVLPETRTVAPAVASFTALDAKLGLSYLSQNFFRWGTEALVGTEMLYAEARGADGWSGSGLRFSLALELNGLIGIGGAWGSLIFGPSLLFGLPAYALQVDRTEMIEKSPVRVGALARYEMPLF